MRFTQHHALAEPCISNIICMPFGKLGCIEIQCRSTQDRGPSLCLYLCRRHNFRLINGIFIGNACLIRADSILSITANIVPFCIIFVNYFTRCGQIRIANYLTLFQVLRPGCAAALPSPCPWTPSYRYKNRLGVECQRYF